MHVDLRPPSQAATRSALWHVNAALARPIAFLFTALGVAPGQLSLQSVTLTAVGLLRAASGDTLHVVQGCLIVYAGVIIDRADDLLAERALVTAWSRFLGLAADRIVEAGLVVALAWFTLTGHLGDGPLATDTFLALLAALAALVLLNPLLRAYADLQLLRVHLAASRRLPGPSAVPRHAQRRAFLSIWLDRDLMVLAWAVAVAVGAAHALVLALLAVQVLLIGEAVVLFWSRRKDPEPYAAIVLSRGPQ